MMDDDGVLCLAPLPPFLLTTPYSEGGIEAV